MSFCSLRFLSTGVGSAGDGALPYIQSYLKPNDFSDRTPNNRHPRRKAGRKPRDSRTFDHKNELAPLRFGEGLG